MSDINFDAGTISESLNGKVDLPTGKSQDQIDYVVDWQTPTAANGYTWYRKYKSGWVEQGVSKCIKHCNKLANSNGRYSLYSNNNCK